MNNYNFFDQIYCINLKHRKDRYNSAINTFKQINLHNVTFFMADKHKKGGRYGCFDSHIQVIKNAFNNNYNNILIFEDDIKIGKFYSNLLLKKSINFMKNNNKWDVFYLGYFPFSYNYKIIPITDNIFKSNPFGCHSYCLNKKSIVKILNKYQYGIGNYQYDIWLSMHSNLNIYCITPIIFDQYFSFSTDNSTHGILEYIFRKIQPIFENYNINSNVSLIIYNYYKNKNIIFILLIFYLIFIILNSLI